MSKKAPYHHGDLKVTLLNEAVAMIREEGVASISMRKLAARAGVSRMAPYHHFGDKQGLFCAIAEEGFVLFEQISDGLALDGSASANEVLRLFMYRYVNFALENSAYYDFMFGGQLWRSDQLTDSLKEQAYSSFRSFSVLVSNMLPENELPEGVNSLRFAQVVWSSLHGLSRFAIDGIYVGAESIESICDAAVDLMLR